MQGVILYFDICMLAIDFITIRSLRKFLIDFLRIKKNKKSVGKIYAEQTPESKVTLSFIKPLLKTHASIFNRYQRLYLIILYSIVPQYLIIISCNVLLELRSTYVVIFFAAIKLIIYFIVRFNTDANRASLYRKH